MNAKEVAARREALQRELWEAGHKVGLLTGEQRLARNARMAELQRQIDELPEPEPQETGEAAGIVQVGEFLGSPWAPPPREGTSDPDADHPHIREYGDRIR